MYDRRVVRGTTYASIIMPATGLPSKPKPREVTKGMQEQQRPQSEERRVATPEPLPGRVNVQVETEEVREELTDKAPEGTFDAQTDFYIDRPVACCLKVGYAIVYAAEERRGYEHTGK
jgi:hypothetical protein